MVADIKSERWPASPRNGWPASIGIRNRLALTFAGQLGLATSPVPVTLKESAISMLWHSSYDHDPAHRWLREVMVGLSRDAAGDPARAAM